MEGGRWNYVCIPVVYSYRMGRVLLLLTITATTSSSSSITLHPSRYTKQAARYGDMDHHQLTGHRVHGIDY